MLMPSHAKRVKLYRDPSVPLFHRFQVEGQIDAIHSPVVQLRSGGYVVINPTEALVAIDVNSGRSTKERNIEETALKTNCEAAEEVARQLRLRDLAGLVVIDFIDMEEYRNRSTVERRLKDSMRFDRARIQLGRISPFGLLELSRQRLRSSLVEASTQPCPHCNGTGVIRSIESTALHVLRAIEEEGMRRRSAEIGVTVPPRVALYVLNQKRAAVQLAESRFGFKVMIDSDDTLVPPAFRLERLRVLTPAEIAALPIFVPPPPEPDEEDEAIADEDEAVAAAPEEAPAEQQDDDEENGSGRGRGRRRRRRGWREDGAEREVPPSSAEPVQPLAAIEDEAAEPESAEASAAPDSHEPQAAAEPGSEADRKRRRRGRRGGRRRRRETGGPERLNGANGEHHEGEDAPDERTAAEEAEEIEVVAAEDAPETETIELVPPPPVHEQASRDVAEAFTSAPALPEAVHATASVPVSDGNGEASHHPSEPERASIHYNVPPPHEVTDPPANPRRGWWRR
jgi:ribonuclease E